MNNRERTEKCYAFQYGLTTSVSFFSMVARTCLLFQLMKQKRLLKSGKDTSRMKTLKDLHP